MFAQKPGGAHLQRHAFRLLILHFVCRNFGANGHHIPSALSIGFVWSLARKFTVAPKVRITADRACEVRIVLPVQRKVSEAIAIVMRLLHTAKNAHDDFIIALRSRNQMLVKLKDIRIQVRIAAARLSEFTERNRTVLEQVGHLVIKFHDVLCIRSFVNTVHTLQMATFEFSGAALVCNEHAFFDPVVGFIFFSRHDLFRFAVFVKLAAEFRTAEFQNAVLATILAKKCRHFLQGLHMFVAFFQTFYRFAVCNARGNVHHALLEFKGFHMGFLVEFHEAAERETVHALMQRTQIARKTIRKHRHSRPRQILRKAARQRFIVEFRAFRYIMAHVGNMHAQAEASIRTFFDGNRIVMVHGAVRVNAKNVKIPQIDSAVFQILFARSLLLVHKFHNGIGELFRKRRILDELRLHIAPLEVAFHRGTVNLRKH